MREQTNGSPAPSEAPHPLWREVRHHGWRFWVGLARRALPWVMLLVVLSQVKRLNDELRSVESHEFRQVQSEISGLRGELGRFEEDVGRTHRQLLEVRAHLKDMNEALERDLARTPGVSRAMEDAVTTAEQLDRSLPAAASAATLAAQLQQTTSALDAVRAALPASEKATALAAQLQSAVKSLGELRTGIPDAKRTGEVSAALDGLLKELRKRQQALAAAPAAVLTSGTSIASAPLLPPLKEKPAASSAGPKALEKLDAQAPAP